MTTIGYLMKPSLVIETTWLSQTSTDVKELESHSLGHFYFTTHHSNINILGKQIMMEQNYLRNQNILEQSFI